ncbi:MAG: hypothetical protein Kow0069_32000 [Promethearchaeota archaeon]
MIMTKVFFQYVAPIVVDVADPFTGGAGRMWPELAVAFADLYVRTKGKVERLGRFEYCALAYWPLWLVPVTEDYSTYLDGLNLTRHKVPVPAPFALPDVREVANESSLERFTPRVEALARKLRRAVATSPGKAAKLAGFFSPRVFSHLRELLSRPVELYSDDFFLLEPVLRESEVMVEASKVTQFLREEVRPGVEETASLIDAACAERLEQHEERLRLLSEAAAEEGGKWDARVADLERELESERRRFEFGGGPEEEVTGTGSVPPFPIELDQAYRALGASFSRTRAATRRGDLEGALNAMAEADAKREELGSRMAAYRGDLAGLASRLAAQRERARKAAEERLRSLEERLADVRLYAQAANREREGKLAAARAARDALVAARALVKAAFEDWLESESGQVQSFLESYALPIRGSLQVVGLPIVLLGFGTGDRERPRVTPRLVLPKVARESPPKRKGRVDLSEGKAQTKLRAMVAKHFAENLDEVTRLARLKDLSKLPKFRAKLAGGLREARRVGWLSPRQEGAVLEVVENLAGLEFRERARGAG